MKAVMHANCNSKHIALNFYITEIYYISYDESDTSETPLPKLKFQYTNPDTPMLTYNSKWSSVTEEQ
jgi:hypothetical protein